MYRPTCDRAWRLPGACVGRGREGREEGCVGRSDDAQVAQLKKQRGRPLQRWSPCVDGLGWRPSTSSRCSGQRDRPAVVRPR